MWRNYLLTGVRALLKNRTYAAINIGGLAIGLAACLLIGLFVREHLNFDRWVADGEDVYQLQTYISDPQSGAVVHGQNSPYVAGQAVLRDFPGIRAQSIVMNSNLAVMDNGQARSVRTALVGPDFFKIFPLTFIQGSAATAIPDPGAIALSRRTAFSLFGTEQAVGRKLTYQGDDGARDLRVTAVFEDLPRASSFQTASLRLYVPADRSEGETTKWGYFNGWNYYRFARGTDIDSVNRRLQEWAQRVAPRELDGGRMVSVARDYRFAFAQLPAIHLSGASDGPSSNGMARSTVVTFAVLAVLILIMACVNFTNLATARASQRAREVALRKVLGARRRQLIVQFLAEATIVSAIAMLLAVAAAELALPALRRALRLDMTLDYLGTDRVLPAVLLLTLLVGLIAGLYPAFYLTRVQPARVLKANRSASEAEGAGRLRNLLVVVQFAVSIGLIVCTAVVYGQTVFARNVDPGFRRENVLQIDGIDRPLVRRSIAALIQEVRRVSGVRDAALTGMAQSSYTRSTTGVEIPGQARSISVGVYGVGPRFFEVMGMRLLAGRLLSEDQAKDWTQLNDDPATAAAEAAALNARGVNVVVNEAAARKLGFGSLVAAIGKTARIGMTAGEGLAEMTIVGVVADTRFRSARQRVEPIVFHGTPAQAITMVVRTDGNDPLGTRARIEALWKRVVPTLPFSSEWANDAAGDDYAADDALSRVFAGFALLSVIIGCLGLFGLATFTAQRRTKEIGIRKVLGARTGDIVRLLVWQFTKPVAVANLIAWPVAWWVMRDWLNGFESRIALTPLPFLLAGGLALAIAVATIAGHAAKVARATPIRALRYE